MFVPLSEKPRNVDRKFRKKLQCDDGNVMRHQYRVLTALLRAGRGCDTLVPHDELFMGFAMFRPSAGVGRLAPVTHHNALYVHEAVCSADDPAPATLGCVIVKMHLIELETC